MNERQEEVGPLKKITLSWEAGRTPDNMDLTAGQGLFHFIYGIGKQGLSPLETRLAHKRVGETILLTLERDKLAEVFEHVDTSFLDLPETVQSFHLRLSVKEVMPADPREVIKAMAENAGCEDHCCGH